MKKPRVRRPNNKRSFSISEMTFEDLDDVYRLGSRLFTADKWPTLYRAWDEYEIVNQYASDGEFCLVARRDDGRIIGFALGTLMKKPRSSWCYGWLLWLGVAPRMQGRGVAARLLNRLTSLFIRHGARMMLVDTDAENTRALGFFDKLGFGDAQHHVYLSKSLISHPHYIDHRTDIYGEEDEDTED